MKALERFELWAKRVGMMPEDEALVRECIEQAANDCKHPGCGCVCGHQQKCPEDGPCATGGFGEKWAD
jgi:hypothetical protein